jgi:hypothetical protein
VHPGCPQRQSRSGVFSIASHAALQYFSVDTQEQLGCAHFSPFAAIAVLLSEQIADAAIRFSGSSD